MTTSSKLSVKTTKPIRLVLISDTHELHRELDVPDGDILIHCGDISMMSRSLAAIEDFDDWLGGLPHKVKLLVPGNHEFVFEDPARQGLISNATLLINESVKVMGLRIWGSPTTPLVNGAFGVISDRTAPSSTNRYPKTQTSSLPMVHHMACSIKHRAPSTMLGAVNFLQQCNGSSPGSTSSAMPMGVLG